MYLLIEITTNDRRSSILVSKTKKKLEQYVKDKGFYWSKSLGRYIDDKNTGILGGSGTDYIIEKIDLI